jgi:hypothetical protein
MTPSLILFLALMNGSRMYVMPAIDIKATPPARSQATSAALPSRDDLVDKPEVMKPTPAQRAACPKPGTVCLLPWARAASREQKAGRIMATLERDHGAEKPEWDVELIANFKAPATSEPIIIAAFDKEDRESIEHHEAIQIWDVTAPAARILAMHFALSAENGFNEARDYLVQIVQIGKAGPRVLAQGDVTLQ